MKVIALLLIYVVWGTTYLGVKVGLESLPPFLLIGMRLILAGALLYTWRRIRTRQVPNRSHWVHAASVGFLILVCGLGVVVWSVQTVPSGLAALLISTMPVWLILMEARMKRQALRPKVLWGLCLGLLGVALLLTSLGEIVGPGPLPTTGILAILAAAASWAAGSLRARSVKLCADGGMSVGIQMLTAGILLSGLGLLSGESIDLPEVTLRSWLAFAYLTLFGSLIAFSAYVWLLKKCSASLVSTYAYVNPVVALFAGYVWGGEPIGPTSLVASLVILVGVALMMSAGKGNSLTDSKPETHARVQSASPMVTTRRVRRDPRISRPLHPRTKQGVGETRCFPASLCRGLGSQVCSSRHGVS